MFLPTWLPVLVRSLQRWDTSVNQSTVFCFTVVRVNGLRRAVKDWFYDFMLNWKNVMNTRHSSLSPVIYYLFSKRNICTRTSPLLFVPDLLYTAQRFLFDAHRWRSIVQSLINLLEESDRNPQVALSVRHSGSRTRYRSVVTSFLEAHRYRSLFVQRTPQLKPTGRLCN